MRDGILSLAPKASPSSSPSSSPKKAPQLRYKLNALVANTLFGQIKLGMDTRSKDPVAVKIYSTPQRTADQALDDPANEIDCLKFLKGRHHHGSKNIVQMLDNYMVHGKSHLVLEWCSNGDLFSLLESQEDMLLERSTALGYFRQMVDAISFLHDNDMAHLDVSLENVLLAQDGSAKLCDFGLARFAVDAMTSGRKLAGVGKVQYMAPEIANPAELTADFDVRSADMYSLGVCLFLLLTGFLPYDEPHVKKDQKFGILMSHGVGVLLQCFQQELEPPLVAILGRLLCRSSKRMKISELAAALEAL